MGARQRNIGTDGTWTHYRSEPGFAEVLEGTARAWVSLLELCAASPSQRGTRVAYERAVLALAQLPIEFAGSDTRFERSRWRAATVLPGQAASVHCEHPWTKKRTKELVWAVASDAIRRGAAREAVVAAVGAILAARQDTVLLPHARLSELGVLSERHHDGIASRYASAVSSGALVLVDRLDGTTVTHAALVAHEADAAREVHAAVERLAGHPSTWGEELRAAVEHAVGEPVAAGGARPIGTAPFDWIGAIQAWLTARLGAGTTYAPKGFLSITPPAPRRRKGALHGYEGRGRPLLVFRCARRDHWVGALSTLGARPGDGDRIQIPLPCDMDLAQLDGALADWV